MASTQPHTSQQSPSQQLVVSTTSGVKNRVMPNSSSAMTQPGASGSNMATPVASGSAVTPAGLAAPQPNPAQQAAAAAAAALTMSVPPNANQTNQDLASLFECPVCFDYVLPPILQVRKIF